MPSVTYSLPQSESGNIEISWSPYKADYPLEVKLNGENLGTIPSSKSLLRGEPSSFEMPDGSALRIMHGSLAIFSGKFQFYITKNEIPLIGSYDPYKAFKVCLTVIILFGCVNTIAGFLGINSSLPGSNWIDLCIGISFFIAAILVWKKSLLGLSIAGAMIWILLLLSMYIALSPFISPNSNTSIIDLALYPFKLVSLIIFGRYVTNGAAAIRILNQKT